MPRNGSGVYSTPAGTAAVSGDPVSSSKFNTLVTDLVDDANTARPVVAGGTGATSESGARTNLGLGDGATSNAQTSATDTTAGALLTPGAFGWGETEGTPYKGDLDDLTDPSGAYRFIGSASGTFPGSVSTGVLLNMRRSDDSLAQIIVQGSNEAVYHRTAQSGTLTGWRRLDTPAGAVQAFAMSTVPDGWLECDGSNVSRATYADLFDAISTDYGSGNGSTTFGLPDLRGEFVRGWDHGKGTDSGRAIGSSQDDEIKEHTHDLNDVLINSGASGRGVSGAQTTGIQETDGITGGGGDETRPRNIALMYCIKV